MSLLIAGRSGPIMATPCARRLGAEFDRTLLQTPNFALRATATPQDSIWTGAAAAQDRGYGALALVLAEPQVRDLGICAVIPEPTRSGVVECFGEAVSGSRGGDLGRRRHAPIILISR